MNMLKKLALCALAAIVAMALTGALAETIIDFEYPLDPCYEEAQLPAAFWESSGMTSKDGNAMTIRGKRQNGGFEKDTTWTINIAGGVAPYQYRFYIVALDTADQKLSTGDTQTFRDWGSSNEFSYQFVAPGYYALLVFVRDSVGNEQGGGFRLSLTDTSRLTVKQRAEQLVAQCRAAGVTGDYETALWLHDWLTMNARNDHDNVYRGADGVLMRGLGNCDSYSKAYGMLLSSAGIENKRIIGVKHSWNTAKLNGDWVQIDTTWDDFDDYKGSDGPVSGYEMHIYFGITDDLMQIDHVYDPPVACTSLKQNYYIRSGKVSMWADSVKADTLTALAKGCYAFEVGLPYYYKLENGYSMHKNAPVVYTLVQYALNQQRTFTYSGQKLPLTFDLSIPQQLLSAEIDFKGKAITLPAKTKTVQALAFSNDKGIMYVSLSGVTAIGSKAFSGCTGLWRVDLPQKTIAISDTAFEGLTHVTLVGPEGGAAQTYAAAHGLFWVKG